MMSIVRSYDLYKEKYPESKLSKKDYIKINEEFNKKVIDRVIDGFDVDLPHNMGTMNIKKKKINAEHPPVDFNETKKARDKDPNAEFVYHLNFHSDGFVAKLKWRQKRTKISGVWRYRFVGARGNRGTSPRERMAVVMNTPGGHKRYKA